MILAVLALLMQQSVTIEQDVAEESYFVGQVIPVTVTVEVDADFAEQSLIQLFRRKLDLPLQIELPWLQAEGLRVLRGPVHLAAGRSLAVAGEPLQVAVTELAGGRLRVELAWQLLANAPGSLSLAAPRVRYAYASDFERGLLGGRRPKNRLDGLAEAAPIALELRELPSSDRPPDFGGAVGQFQIEAHANRTRVEVGESVLVELRITGDGDLVGFDAPNYGQLPGFDLLGQLEKESADARVLVYEFAPRAGSITEIPPLRFVSFDPQGGGRYHVQATAPLPLDVIGDDVIATGDSSADSYVWPSGFDASPRIRGAEALGAWTLALLPSAVLLLLVGRRTWRQLRSRPRFRLRLAARRFLAATRGADADQQRRNFERFLTDVFETDSRAAIAAPDLGHRLHEAGMSPSVARKVVALAVAILAAEYGGLSKETSSFALQDFAAAIREEARR